MATYIATSIDGGNTFSAQVYANPQNTATDAITGQTDVLGPEGDNGTAADNSANSPYGFGTSMGLAVYAGQVYPIWAGNFDEAHFVNRRARRQCPVHLLPADGHRGRAADRQQHHGADRGVHHQLYRHIDDRISGGHRPHQYDGVVCRGKHYRHRSPVRRDDLDRQQFHLDHAVGDATASGVESLTATATATSRPSRPAS